jgi:glycosyltransferase involved in cell wall biosynthesis
MGFYFAREFRRRGWRVTALCQPPPSGDDTSVIDRLRETGVEVEMVQPFGGRLDLVLVDRFETHLRRNGSTLLVSMHQQDMKFAAIAGRRSSVPYVVSGQNTFTFSGNRLRRWLAARVLRILLNRHCQGVVATSPRVADEFRNLLGFRGDIEIQPNGVDTFVFRGNTDRREEIRMELGASPETFVVVSVGRITRQKNQIGLVEAFGQVFPAGMAGSERYQLWMVGSPAPGTEDMAYRREVEARISGLGLRDRARVTGWRTDVPDVLSAADLYVQSSLWEGSPLAVLEAMASGLAVIVADNGGVLPEFRMGKHGWVVPMGEAGGLAKPLGEAGGMSLGELKAMGEASRELATGRYDARLVAGRFFEFASGRAKRG